MVFLGIFAADVIEPGKPFWQTLGELIIHLIPAIGVAIVVGWKKTWLTGMLFILLGIFFICFFSGTSLVNRVIVAGPGILIGALFLAVAFLKHPAKGGS